MTLSLTQLFWVFLTCLVFSGLFSMLEASVISQDKHRLQHLAAENDARARVMQGLLRRTDRLLSTILLCNNLANVSCAASATAIAARLLPESPAALLWVTFIVTFMLLVFSEITPKVIGVRYASPIALAMARPLAALVRVLSPFTMVANVCSDALLACLGIRAGQSRQAVMSPGELRTALRLSARAENALAGQYQMLDNTLRFGELSAEKLMTPRNAIAGINLQDAPQNIRAFIRRVKFSKLPIYDGGIDNAVGVIDTLRALKLPPEMPDARLADTLRAMASEILYIPAASSAAQQLDIMRRRDSRLGLVADGSGRVVGMLTYADFSAAIIGGEKASAETRADDAGRITLSGKTTLLQLEQLVGATTPPAIDATTINGMVLEYLGDMPATPVCVVIGDWKIEILRMDDKFISSVRVMPVDVSGVDAPADAPEK